MRKVLLGLLAFLGKVLMLAVWLGARVIHEATGVVERTIKEKLNK